VDNTYEYLCLLICCVRDAVSCVLREVDNTYE
jgi:hypothetical protein